MSENFDGMELWNQVCETNPEMTKHVNQRGGFTAIDSMSQIKKATELWGPFGGEWGLREFWWDKFFGAENSIIGLTLVATFWYPGGSFSIAADMPYKPNDDCAKKLQTECISKALSRLGFNADVFMGKFDDNKYVAEMRDKHAGTGGGEQPPQSSKVGAGTKKRTSKIPDPSPTAAGVLGSVAQKYMKLLEEEGQANQYYVDYKVLSSLVYKKYKKYPTKLSSIPTILKAIPLTEVIRENDFLEGLE
jgi:hypothetical protein